MTRISPVFRLLVFCLFPLSVTAKAQDYLFATGSPTFSVNIPVENGYINVANGSLHLEFPLANHKQRGALILNERLVYDSRIWMIGHYSNYYWWPTGVPNAPYTQGGWRFVSGGETGTLSKVVKLTQPLACSRIAGSSQYGSATYTWVDPGGTSHGFGQVWNYQPLRCSNIDPPPENQTASGWAVDGSGYQITLSGRDNGLPSSIQIIDNNGNQVYPQVKDRYGNYWSNDANGNLVDDVGRTPVITTVNGNVTYYDVLAPNGTINNNGTRVRYTVTVAPITVSTQFNQQAVTEWPDGSTPGTLSPIQSVGLPDGSSYSFTYDSYGELASMTLPTGGVIHYGWINYFDSYNNANRWISSHTIGNDPATTFTSQVLTQCASNGTGCQQQVKVHKPSGDETVYQLTLNNGAWNTNTTVYNGAASSGNIAMSVANTYDFSHPCNPSVCVGAQYIQRSTSATTLNTGLKSQIQYVYNNPQLGKPTSIKNWDYFSGSAPSAPNAETDYEYSSFDLTKATTFDNGTQVHQTTYGFTTSAAPTSGVPQHTTASGPYLQSVSEWLNTSGASIGTSYTMDDTGSVVQVTDAKGNPPISISYQCGNSLPYQVTNSLGHVTTYGYECNSGAITSVKDPNDLAAGRAGTAYQYESGEGRLQSISYPDGGQTTYSYPSAKEVDTAVLATPNPTINSQDIADDFGRPYRHVQANSSIETSYDANGRISCVTNPHYSSPSSTDGNTCTSSYDGLDRPLIQTQPDNNTLTWSYSGNTVASTDEAGHSWQRTSDAFGRLTKVMEPNGAETDYTYNLFTTTVSQKGVGVETPRPNRIFTSDSLGRTVSVNEPESGNTTYGFDNNGNVTSKTDARGVTVSYAYDVLNRLTWKHYSDGTPQQAFSYDGKDESGNTLIPPVANAMGRLSHTSNQVNVATSYSYDTMGRIVHQWNCIPSDCSTPQLSAAYDLAGNMTSFTYPDGRVIAQSFDGAARLQNVIYDNWNGQHVGYTYASGFTYTPMGAQTEFWLGNGVYVHTPYNNRQQMCQVWSNSSQGWIDTHIYYGSEIFCNSTSGNNGSISEVKDWKNPNHTQHFGYDGLNRLSSFHNDDINNSMNQSYSYDSFGNLKQSAGTLGGPSCCDVNNRINDSGFGYDSAGNLTNLTVAGISSSYAFNGEDQLSSINNGSATYTYDAFGQRVRKEVVGSGWTEYVYFNGQPMAEKNSNGIWSDYIYSNGQLIARADSHDIRIHFTGTNCSNCGPQFSQYNFPIPSYTIQAGDKIAWRQFQEGPAAPRGGLALAFSDGTLTNWGTTDQNGEVMNDLTTQNQWVYRIADLSQHAGKTIIAGWINADSQTGAGDWQEWFSEIAFYRMDGTVVPIYHRQTNVSLSSSSSSGVTNKIFEVHLNPEGATPMTTTTYYIGDQIGSKRMTFAAGGWPVESSTLYPFGQEQFSVASPDHYKFAMLERDGESGLDHATFRQYSPNMGRWMSPDPYLGSYDFADPQSFNRYAYVGNKPLIGVDPSGLQNGEPVRSGGDCGLLCSIFGSLANGLGSLFGFGSPSFTGAVQGPSPDPSAVTKNGDGMYTIKVYSNLYTYGGNFQLAGLAPASGEGTPHAPSNPTPTPIKIHGNWCGPDWTGGTAGQYSPTVNASGGYKPPTDSLDGNCMQHDKCYAACRQSNTCDASARGSCFAKCDLGLASATNSEISVAGAAINILFTFRSTNTWPFRPDPYRNPASCQVLH